MIDFVNEPVLNIEEENKQVALKDYGRWWRKHNKHKIKQYHKDTYKSIKKKQNKKVKLFTIKIELINEF